MRRPDASKKVGGTSSAAVPDPLAGIERRPRPSRRPRGHDAGTSDHSAGTASCP